MIYKATLRKQMGALRKAKSAEEQQRAAASLVRKLHKQPTFQRAQHITAYLAINGELDPLPLLRHANRLGKTIYLPVIKGNRLTFVRYQPGKTQLARNRYGILEPRFIPGSVIAPTDLDLVLTPLLAFDGAGRRLGTGGGFYDRTFAFKRRRHPSAKPLLLGIAHACQQVEKIPTDPWDIPLKGVATDRDLFL